MSLKLIGMSCLNLTKLYKVPQSGDEEQRYVGGRELTNIWKRQTGEHTELQNVTGMADISV